MRRRLSALVLLLVTSLAAGCTGDSDEPSGTGASGSRTAGGAAPSETGASVHEYVEALAEGLVTQDAPMDEQQARCFSDGLLDVVGLERAQRLGPPEELVERTRGLDFRSLRISRKEGERIFDQFDVCGVDIRQATVEDVSRGMTKKQQRCLARAVTGDRVREYYVTHMVRGTAPAGIEPDSDGTKGKKGKKKQRGTKQSQKERSQEDGAEKRGSGASKPRDPGDSPLMKAMVKCLR